MSENKVEETRDLPARDIEIQEMLDAGRSSDSNDDTMAYRQVYKVLEESNATVSSSFAYNVMVKILRGKLASNQSSVTLTSILLSSLAFVIGGIVALVSPGLDVSVTTSAFMQLAQTVPTSVIYLLVILLAVALIDLVIGKRQALAA